MGDSVQGSWLTAWQRQSLQPYLCLPHWSLLTPMCWYCTATSISTRHPGAFVSLRSSSAAVEISLHEFCTIWESLHSCIHVSYICPYRQPCLKPVNFLNSWGCNSKHPKLRKLKRCTAGRKNAKTCHALLQVTSLLSFGESSEHKLALR